jgi:hypothetical protein
VEPVDYVSTRRWVRDESVLSRRVPGGILLLAPDAAEPVLVTGSGVALWEILDEPMTVDEAVGIAATWFAAAPKAITPDVERTVHALASRGLLKVAS